MSRISQSDDDSELSDAVYVPTEAELVRTAYHEAGHAALHVALTLGCKFVTIEPDYSDMSAGSSWHGGEYGKPAKDFNEKDDDVAQLRDTAEEAFYLRHAIACYAGAEAVRRWNPALEVWEAGAEDDYRSARDMIDNITGGDTESFDYLRGYARRRARVLVEYYWPEIVSIATALREAKSLTGTQVDALLSASLRGRRAARVGY